jgi:hypothetical protein
MFIVDLDTLKVDCDPHPVCVRLKHDRPLCSSLNPTLERVLLDSDELSAICDAYQEDRPDVDFDSDAVGEYESDSED